MIFHLLCMLLLLAGVGGCAAQPPAAGVTIQVPPPSGADDDAPSIQDAIDRCHAAGGGRVVLPAGAVFTSGPLRLRSGVELHLAKTALLRVNLDRSVWPAKGRSYLVSAEDAENIAITGPGTIDGQGRQLMAKLGDHIHKPGPWRPGIVGLLRCRQVRMQDLVIRDGPHWTVHFIGCDGVLAERLTIRNDRRIPNCDGIDPDHCRNVVIRNCDIEAGDDCIVIKNTRPYADLGPTENIRVENCDLKSTSAALKIGTESVSDFRNIVFDRCRIRDSSRGLVIQLRDEGTVENVVFSNMTVETRLFYEAWWGRAEPIHVSAFARKADGKLGQIRNVRFENIEARSENGVYLSGCDGSRPEGIAFDRVRVRIDKWTDWPGGQHDRRPCAMEGLVPHPTAGFYCAQAESVSLRNCRVCWAGRPQQHDGAALDVAAIGRLTVEGFEGNARR
jgi:polygalacturonase